MTTKQAVISLVAALLVGVAIGRFTLPAKIIVKTETVEVDKSTAATDKNDHSVTTVTQIKKVDGSVVTTTVTAKNVQTDSKVSNIIDKDSKTDKETIYNTASWTLGVIASAKPLSGLHPTVTYGGEVLYKLLGPFQVGAMGLTDGTFGVILGITF